MVTSRLRSAHRQQVQGPGSPLNLGLAKATSEPSLLLRRGPSPKFQLPYSIGEQTDDQASGKIPNRPLSPTKRRSRSSTLLCTPLSEFPRPASAFSEASTPGGSLSEGASSQYRISSDVAVSPGGFGGFWPATNRKMNGGTPAWGDRSQKRRKPAFDFTLPEDHVSVAEGSSLLRSQHLEGASSLALDQSSGRLLSPSQGTTVSGGSAPSVKPSGGWHWDQCAAAQALDLAGIRQRAMKIHRNEITAQQKRANAAEALARDHAAVLEFCNTPEATVARVEREQPVEDRRINILFSPIPRPRRLIPEACRSHGVQELLSPREPPREEWPNTENVRFSPEERTAFIRVCQAWAALMRPFTAQCDKAEEDIAETLVLTRPALSCLLISVALEGPGGKLIYQRAIECFDKFAEPLSVRGSPFASGNLRGIHLEDVITHADSATELFEILLVEIAEAYANQQKEFKNLNDVKQHFFDSLLRGAFEKATSRTDLLKKRLALGKNAGVISADEVTKIQQLRRLSLSNSSLDVDDENVSREESGRPSSKEGPWQSEADAVVSSATTDGGADASSSARDDGDDENEGKGERARLSPDDALFAHTVAVSKGELLSGMLLEPEAIQFVWMYYDLFVSLFEAYHETGSSVGDKYKTSSQRPEHMTQVTFMKFCMDFGLFPAIVDFSTLQTVYACAESSSGCSKKDMPFEADQPGEDNAFKVGDQVELWFGATIDTGSGVPLRVEQGEKLQVIEVDFKSSTRAVRVMTKKLRKFWVKVEDVQPSGVEKDKKVGQRKSTFQRKPLHSKLSWLRLDAEEMDSQQLGCLSILSALETWMTSKRLKARDVFGIVQSQKGNKSLTATEFHRATQYLNLDSRPTIEQIELLYKRIDVNDDGCVDYDELDAVMMTVRERKAKARSKANFFLKESADMSSAETAASDFFVPLGRALHVKCLSSAEFFKRYDVDNSGQLSCSELLVAGQEFGLKAAFFTDEGSIYRALAMCIPDFTGAIGIRDFNRLLALVNEKIQLDETDPVDCESPFLDVASRETEQIKRIFGVKAFIESLLKIGLGYLTFHGTSLQSDLPVYTKLIWLLTYLSWQFDRRKMEMKVTMAFRKDKTAPEEDRMHVTTWNKLTTAQLTDEEASPAQSQLRLTIVRRFSEKGEEDAPPLPEIKNSKNCFKLHRQISDSMDLMLDLPHVDRNLKQGKTAAQRGRLKVQKVVKEKLYAKYLPPIKRLATLKPNLFHEEPQGPPRLKGVSYERSGLCHSCERLPYKGWGNASCTVCGLGDTMVTACMADECSAELPSLDHLVRVRVKTTKRGSVVGRTMSQTMSWTKALA